MIHRTWVVKNLIFQQNWNLLILPNFMFHRTGLLKNLKFESNFQCDYNLFILPSFYDSQDLGGQKFHFFFWLNFELIDWNFLILPYFMVCRTGWSKILNLSKIFNVYQIAWFCQISCFARCGVVNKFQIWVKFSKWPKFIDFVKLAAPGWSKLSNLSNIFNEM